MTTESLVRLFRNERQRVVIYNVLGVLDYQLVFLQSYKKLQQLKVCTFFLAFDLSFNLQSLQRFLA